MYYVTYLMKVVTSYPNPDLDGTASAFAYAELLQAIGERAQVALHGEPDKEARAALAYWDLTSVFDRGELAKAVEIVLVDTSNLSDFPRGFDSTKVVEIIDHRELHEAKSFPNAKIQIELVGAAATLVAEKFSIAQLKPQQPTAGLLFGAIASNTVSLRSSNTTERDRRMYDLLQPIAAVGTEYLRLLREARSQYAPGELAAYLWNDRSVRETRSKKVTILQIEAEHAEQLFRERRVEIDQVLARVRAEDPIDHAFLNVIDLGTGENFVYVDDPDTARLVSKRLHIRIEQGIGRLPSLLLRKQISPLL